MTPVRLPRPLSGALLVVASLGASCLYDENDRCGVDQELSGTQACVCEDGLVLVGTRCEPCPEHELEVDGVCACEEGFERPAEGQDCMPIVVGGLGASCSDSAPCADEVFDTCMAGGVQGHYCTSRGCAVDEDCDLELGYACNTSGPESFCERPPLGQGADCSSSEDCAGGDATFCESFQNQVCLVPGCSLQQNDCFAGWECCDLSKAPVTGLPPSVCTPVGRCAW